MNRVFLFVTLVVWPGFVQAGVISEAPRVTTLLMRLLTVALSVTAIVAILSLSIAGMRYMLSSGNQTDIASAKQHAVQVGIGLVLALSALIIVRQIAALL